MPNFVCNRNVVNSANGTKQMQIGSSMIATTSRPNPTASRLMRGSEFESLQYSSETCRRIVHGRRAAALERASWGQRASDTLGPVRFASRRDFKASITIGRTETTMIPMTTKVKLSLTKGMLPKR